ncbi:Lysine-specific demethylase 8 [Neolecta irregularis DAH-3]|uniref:Lysine-specific demethylase 8 n=1 Tax=Neolecta irregularis (strain DAH-3) TaxID=1198029 RepID=A0A1U7LMR5_NEOID|nr:Lysine-specific demethylase 8 [Neolecta irregularis DAH-3]|eukprot:OLL23918.1 Lysine-specific demethylase 8 [Neolecta irregularis DAH-3]
MGGRRLVPVELGGDYTQAAWTQQWMPFARFLEAHILAPRAPPAYLAQHDLFAQIPALRADVCVPDYCFARAGICGPDYCSARADLCGPQTPSPPPDPLPNVWFGSRATTSPLHTDPYHNILCQVLGYKYFRLYAPQYSSRLYPRSPESGVDMGNTSQVDIANPDYDAFPDLRNAKFVDGILRPGDALYIPLNWWHYLHSLTVSLSVSFWF